MAKIKNTGDIPVALTNCQDCPRHNNNPIEEDLFDVECTKFDKIVAEEVDTDQLRPMSKRPCWCID